MAQADDLMRVVAGGLGKTGSPPSPPPGAGAQSSGSAPAGVPITTPQPQEGAAQASMVDVSIAMDLLERALTQMGSETLPGQALYKAIGVLAKEFGERREKAQPLQGAELQQLVSSMGNRSPEMMSLAGGGGQPQQPMAA